MASAKIVELTSPEFKSLMKRTGAVIIPFGSVEAHGSHLPLGTDTLQVEAIASMIAEKMNILMAPCVPYGVCLSTRDHPGTVTLTTKTLRGILQDLIHAFHRQGIHTFIIISGHAGKTHFSCLRDTAENLLRENPDMKIALISEYDLIRDKGADLLSTVEDGHAGELETSRMQYLSPHLVQGSAPEEYPAWSPYILTADKVSRWPGSVWGNPQAGHPEKGKLLVERSVEEICSIIHELINS